MGSRLLTLRLELPLIECEEHLVLLDHGALDVVLRLQKRRDPGADLHGVLGLSAAHELAVDRHGPLHNLGHQDGGRRRGGPHPLLLRLLVLLACAEGKSQEQEDREAGDGRPGWSDGAASAGRHAIHLTR